MALRPDYGVPDVRVPVEAPDVRVPVEVHAVPPGPPTLRRTLRDTAADAAYPSLHKVNI